MERKCILAIRIRGEINSPRRIRDTLRMLRVDRNMTATLLDDRPEYLGMLQKAKDYITWGEPNLDMVRLILEKRGRLVGDHPINDDSLSSLGYKDIDALAKALYDGDTEYHKLEGIKPFFSYLRHKFFYGNYVYIKFGAEIQFFYCFANYLPCAGYLGKEMVFSKTNIRKNM